MLVNRDPDNAAKTNPEMFRLAEKLGQQLVHVICDEPGAKVGDPVGIDFFAVVSFLPRPGDIIELENKRNCQVQRVVFKVVRNTGPDGKSQTIVLIPNVLAHLIGG